MAELSNLLAWGVENSDPNNQEEKRTKLNPAELAALFNTNVQDDPTVMKNAMATIQDPDVSVEDKETAFDNFELLIEQLDNANNIENLKLWDPLLVQLSNPEPRLRLAAAWCCGTAVQNNPPSQAAFFNHNGVPKLVDMALRDPDEAVRKKAIFALSSQVRNSQPSLEAAVKLLPDELKLGELTADDMDKIDALMVELRERSSKVIAQ